VYYFNLNAPEKSRFLAQVVGLLIHYVNASGTIWKDLLLLCLMAYRATPDGTTGFSPYSLMHGTEIILPTIQNMTAKLSPEVRGTNYVGPLENLKSSLKRAYKKVRQNIGKSYRPNKQYYNRMAPERDLSLTK
jgi:hypothetical protein